MFLPVQWVHLTLFTDSFIVRGTVETLERRISDILNRAPHDFIVLRSTTFDEYGSRELAVTSPFAQVNLATVLFAVADDVVESVPELHTPKVSEQALITIPPFRITGRIHLAAERNLADALGELIGRFIPVTEAAFWSDSAGEARQTAAMVAVNHARAQILAPHREMDPWADVRVPPPGERQGGGS
jgi:hypothetical protein